MADDDLTPVNVSERNGRVSVLMLLDIGGGQLAIYGEDRWMTIGQVVKVVEKYVDHRGQQRERYAYQWYWDELEHNKDFGIEKTKTKALAALLKRAGYREVSDSATIPPLFS